MEQRRGSHDKFDPQLASAVIETDSVMFQLCSRGDMKSSGATRNSGMQSVMALTTATERENKDEADVDIKGEVISGCDWVDVKTVH